jgi:Protein of unknown function (DUF3168)
MTVEEAVLDRLRTDAGIIALVASRVYQLQLPQSPTFPAVRVQLIDEPLLYHLRGGGVLSRARVQTDAYAGPASGSDVYRDAAALADAITASLSGQRWDVGGTPARAVTGAFRVDRRALYEGADIQAARILQDWIVWSVTP